MTARRPPRGPADPAPKVTIFADHEVIVPPNRLRKALRTMPPGDADPVTAAESALAALSGEFASWMSKECDRLDAARRAVHAHGFDTETREALFHAAHDIKGEAETFGFPRAAGAAASLCRLLEQVDDVRRIPLVLVDRHVEAVRAIVREHEAPHAEALASALTSELERMTDVFFAETAREPGTPPPPPRRDS